MKLHVRMLEKIIELPECSNEAPGKSALRAILDDLGLEVKGIDVDPERGVTFTIETLANRGDHLYAVGIAREISARTLAHTKIPSVAPQLSERKASIPIRRATEKCPRYTLMEMALPTPMPLRKDVAVFMDEPGKHHAIVDLLNYVQQEFGQPMHAFDYEKVDGEIIIDTATKIETVEALDGKTYQVPEGSILIRDRKKIIAVAGVIGLANSMVTESTRKVLVEAAIFDPVSVRKTARAMGLSTDASYAFERGVDPEGIQAALKRLVHLAGGSAGAVGVSDSAHVLGFSVAEAPPVEKRKISVLLSVLRGNMNLPRLDEVEITARLKNLGYGVDTTAAGKDKLVSVVVPSWRTYDVFNPDDIIEDVARSLSLNRVKEELPPLDNDGPPPNKIERVVTRVRPALLGNGFVEVITSGFYSKTQLDVLETLEPGATKRHVGIKNAIELNNSHLKTTSVFHLTKIIGANRKRGVQSAKVFEVCRLFMLPEEAVSDEPRQREELDYNYEHDSLCMAWGGRWSENEFRKGESLQDAARLFAGAVESIVRSLGGTYSVGKGDIAILHPGMQGSIKIGRSVCGFMGAVHPAVRDVYDVKEEIFYAQLDMRQLFRALSKPEAPTVSDLPMIRRDITLSIPLTEQAGRISRFIDDAEVAHLVQIGVIDDFKRPEEQFRRVTYRLTFQAQDRTLQHEEVDQSMTGILERLGSKQSIHMAS